MTATGRSLLLFLLVAAIAPVAALLARRATPTPDQVRALLLDGRYRGVEVIAQAMVDDQIAQHGRESLPAAQAMDLLAEALRRGDRQRDPWTVALAAEAVALKERVAPSDPKERARSRLNLGLAWFIQVRTEDAVGHLEAAVDLFRESGRDAELALALVYRATAEDRRDAEDEDGRKLRDPALVARLFREAEALQRECGVPALHRDTWCRLHYLGVAHSKADQLEQACRTTQEAIAVARAVMRPDHPSVANSLENLGGFRAQLGDIGGAREPFVQALQIRQANQGDRHPQVAGARYRIGYWQRTLGDLGEAERYLTEALAIYRGLGDGARRDAGRVANDLGMTCYLQGRFAEARRHLEEALVELEDDVADGRAQVWKDLGWSCYSAGDLKAAREAFSRSLDLCRGWVEPQVGLALIHAREGDLAQASDLLDAMLKLPTEPDGIPNERPWLLMHAARLDWRRQRWSAALKHALAAERLRLDYYRRNAAAMAERHALTLGPTKDSGVPLALAVAALPPPSRPAGAIEAAWDALAKSQGTLLAQLSARRRWAAGTADPAHGDLLRRLARSRQAWIDAVIEAGPGAGDAGTAERLRSLRQTTDEDEEAAARAFARAPDRARFEAPEPPGLAEIRSALPRGSALVRFVAVAPDAAGAKGHPDGPEPRYVALVARAGDPAAHLVSLGSRAAIDGLVEQWRRALIHRWESRSAGRRLCERVWDPLLSLLEPARQVFVVAEGALHGINWLALPMADGKFLVESEWDPVVLDLERDLVEFAAAAPAAGSGMLALGAPPACPGRWPALPEAGRELHEVAQRWNEAASKSPGIGAAIECQGPSATRTAFKTHAPGRSVILVAAHGFFLAGAEDALAAGMALHEDQRRNPLLRAGLILAPGERGDQGILSGEELAAMDLRSVDLVALSACDSGIGESTSGEGVYGLRRAFRLAGARATVSTLWKVDDRAARAWMGLFYEEYLRSGRTAVARCARMATRGLLRGSVATGQDLRDPAFWAAFVATGSWR